MINGTLVEVEDPLARLAPAAAALDQAKQS